MMFYVATLVFVSVFFLSQVDPLPYDAACTKVIMLDSDTCAFVFQLADLKISVDVMLPWP